MQLIPELKWFINEELRIVHESKQYTLQQNALLFASIEKILKAYTSQQKQS